MAADMPPCRHYAEEYVVYARLRHNSYDTPLPPADAAITPLRHYEATLKAEAAYVLYFDTIRQPYCYLRLPPATPADTLCHIYCLAFKAADIAEPPIASATLPLREGMPR